MGMTWPCVLDWSYARPGGQACIDYGALGAMRYLGHDGRCINGAERDDLLGHGIGIGLIWETTAGRPLDGYQAGVDDVGSANRYADELGAPGDTRIYYAVDFQPEPWELDGPVSDYFHGIMSAGGRTPRAYGCASVMQRLCGDLGLFPDSWQCAAWSYPGTAPGTPIHDGGYDLVLSPYAHMLQNIGFVLNDSADHNSLITTNVGWMWGIEGDDDVMTDDDFNRIIASVGALLDNRIQQFGSVNLLWKDGDDYLFEVLTDGDGQRVRRRLEPGELLALRGGNTIAEEPMVDVRAMGPDQQAAVRAWREV